MLAIVAVAASGIRVERICVRLRAWCKRRKSVCSAGVSVIYPAKPGGKTEELVLPANIQAFVEAPIYARTHGYLKRWYFDIGRHVQQGQLMAEIDTPEVDQQLAQARADLKSVQANPELARHHRRPLWQNLLEKARRLQAGDRIRR